MTAHNPTRRLTEKAARLAALAATVLAPILAGGAEPAVLFEGADIGDVLETLYGQCYEAGMITEALSADIIVCSAVLNGDEEPVDGMAIINVHDGFARHRIRFALAERQGGVRVWAYPWIEIEEPGGNVLDLEISSTSYLNRVQAVLTDTARSFGTDAAQDTNPWSDYYDSRDEWRLDAHLRSVAFCDAGLARLTAEELERRLETAAFQPVSRDLRSRCEELYEEIFRWGLARGLSEPSVEDYAEYRATLPPEQRVCRGRLALTSICG